VDVQTDHEFFVKHLVAIQNPHFEEPGQLALVDPDDQEDVARVFAEIEVMLLKYCSSFLSGQFDKDYVEEYYQFSDFIGANFAKVELLPESDPIRVKYSNNDYTWVHDLRNRAKRD
jgi:hypothetical protein